MTAVHLQIYYRNSWRQTPDILGIWRGLLIVYSSYTYWWTFFKTSRVLESWADCGNIHVQSTSFWFCDRLLASRVCTVAAHRCRFDGQTTITIKPWHRNRPLGLLPSLPLSSKPKGPTRWRLPQERPYSLASRLEGCLAKTLSRPTCPNHQPCGSSSLPLLCVSWLFAGGYKKWEKKPTFD